MSSAPINLADALASFDDIYSPRIVGRVNDYDVKIAHAKGEHVWHVHDDTDEFFLVLDGQFDIAMRDAQGAETTVVLRKGEIFVVPRGVEHKPSSAGRRHPDVRAERNGLDRRQPRGRHPGARRQHERPRYRLIADETAPTPVRWAALPCSGLRVVVDLGRHRSFQIPDYLHWLRRLVTHVASWSETHKGVALASFVVVELADEQQHA